jgi:hypothetical protein
MVPNTTNAVIACSTIRTVHFVSNQKNNTAEKHKSHLSLPACAAPAIPFGLLPWSSSGRLRRGLTLLSPSPTPPSTSLVTTTRLRTVEPQHPILPKRTLARALDSGYSTPDASLLATLR